MLPSYIMSFGKYRGWPLALAVRMRRAPLVVERAGDVLTSTDIRWTFAPLPQQPTADPLVDALMAVNAYRVLAQQAIVYAHTLLAKVERMEQQYHHALDENRALRTQLRARSTA